MPEGAQIAGREPARAAQILGTFSNGVGHREHRATEYRARRSPQMRFAVTAATCQTTRNSKPAQLRDKKKREDE